MGNASPDTGIKSESWRMSAIHVATRRRRVKRAQENGRHTRHEWDLLQAACDYRCVECWELKPVTKDHIEPLYMLDRGIHTASDAIQNIQPMCKSCNCRAIWDDQRPLDWAYRVAVLHLYWQAVGSAMLIQAIAKAGAAARWKDHVKKGKPNGKRRQSAGTGNAAGNAD